MEYKVINREDIPQSSKVEGGKYYKVLDAMETSGAECVEITDYETTLSSERALIMMCSKTHFNGEYKPMQRKNRLFIVRKG